MTAPVLDAGVWHAPICGALLPCASEAMALSVLKAYLKNSPFAELEDEPAPAPDPEPLPEPEPAPEPEPDPEPVEELDDEESEEVPEQDRCIYFQCQLRRVEGAAQGYEFCERHMKKAANLLGWPLESLMKPTTEKESI